MMMIQNSNTNSNINPINNNTTTNINRMNKIGWSYPTTTTTAATHTMHPLDGIDRNEDGDIVMRDIADALEVLNIEQHPQDPDGDVIMNDANADADDDNLSVLPEDEEEEDRMD